jgi:hypothetical protein
VLAAVLRRYNDALDDRRRQDLYAYAAIAVGTRGSARLERARAEHLRRWISERTPRRWHRWLLPAYVLAGGEPSVDVLAERAVHRISRHDPRAHAVMLGLIDELLALDPRQRAAIPALPDAHARASTPPARSREPSYRGPGAR